MYIYDQISLNYYSNEKVSDKICREKITKHILCSITLLAESRAVYEIMWKNIVEPDRPDMTVWRMRIACWMPKATNTHSEYVILIAFSLQQGLHERVSLLRHVYTVCLVVHLHRSSCLYTVCLVAAMYTYVGPVVCILSV